MRDDLDAVVAALAIVTRQSREIIISPVDDLPNDQVELAFVTGDAGDLKSLKGVLDLERRAARS